MIERAGADLADEGVAVGDGVVVDGGDEVVLEKLAVGGG